MLPRIVAQSAINRPIWSHWYPWPRPSSSIFSVFCSTNVVSYCAWQMATLFKFHAKYLYSDFICLSSIFLLQSLLHSLLLIWNGPSAASFSFIFGLFQTKYTNFYNQSMWKRSSSIRCWDLNPQRSNCESHPITTRRPGLPP